MKKRVREEMRRWRRGVGEGKIYRSCKKQYKELCEKKKERKMRNGRSG